jgi:hypothetical protein
VQDVYARVSLSVASVAAGLGASTPVAVALSAAAGIALVGVAWVVANRGDGDRRAYAAVIGACILASPIVWQNYTALLFLPIAITWTRIHPAWFFSYAIWLAALLPKPHLDGPAPCCKPEDMPEVLWVHSHAEPAWGHAGGTMAVVLVIVGALTVAKRPAGSREPRARQGSGSHNAGRRHRGVSRVADDPVRHDRGLFASASRDRNTDEMEDVGQSSEGTRLRAVRCSPVPFDE